MHVIGRVTRQGMWVWALVSVLAVLALAGCVSGGDAPLGTVGAKDGAAVGKDAPGTAGQTPDQEIPPGRAISEGGGGPAQYTFREEWRRALAQAQKWRSGAYLIAAAGEMINDEGVPSRWSLDFIDKADADAVFKVEVDPWARSPRLVRSPVTE